MEEAISVRRKASAALYKSDKDPQVYTPASKHAWSVITKANTESWQATLS